LAETQEPLLLSRKGEEKRGARIAGIKAGITSRKKGPRTRLSREREGEEKLEGLKGNDGRHKRNGGKRRLCKGRGSRILRSPHEREGEGNQRARLSA